MIDDIAVYSLDHSYKAASVSYEQDPNDTDCWVKHANILSADDDTQTNAEKSEGISTLFIIIYSVMGAIIVALLVVIVIISVKKRGKKQ